MGYNFLIADDDALIRTLLVKAANNRGHTTTECSDGAQAIEAVLASRPDGVLLDLTMPKLDGRDVISRLKSDPSTRDVPVLILTAVDDDLTKELCLEYGAADYVLKPFDVSHVFLKMEHLVEKARARKPSSES